MMTKDDIVLKVSKTPISQMQLAGYAVIIACQAFFAGTVYFGMKTGIENAASKADLAKVEAKVDDMDRYRVSRSMATDKNFDDLRAKMEGLPTLQFTQAQTAKELIEQKTALVEANKRMDRIVEMLGGKLDGITETLNTVKSDVRLLTSKVEALTPEKRAELDRIPTELR